MTVCIVVVTSRRRSGRTGRRALSKVAPRASNSEAKMMVADSRARGERATTNPTHRRAPRHARRAQRRGADPNLWRVLEQLGNPRVIVDPRQRSAAWVEDRRAIDSFFLRELDRDKIVL
jgi:hypothetical protein